MGCWCNKQTFLCVRSEIPPMIDKAAVGSNFAPCMMSLKIFRLHLTGKRELQIYKPKKKTYIKQIQKRKNENENSEISSMQSIIDNSDLFVKQIQFSKYFLMQYGMKIENEMNTNNIPKHEMIQVSDDSVIKNELFLDSFYYNYDSFKIMKHNKDNEDNKVKLLESIVMTTMNLLKNKLVICDELLILSFEICKNIDINNNRNDKSLLSQSSSSLFNKFSDVLKECVSDCLNDSGMIGDQNVRNYYYFKEYLLFSNVWLCKNSNDNNNKINNSNNNTEDMDNSSRLLFNMIDSVIDKQLLKQKEFIYNNVTNEEKTDGNNWIKLCNFGITNDSDGNNGVILRQDSIFNGIKPLQSAKELYLMKCDMNENDNYDIMTEHNSKVYLTQCLTFAHDNNFKFQNEMKKIFTIHGKCKFMTAPVKTYHRCLIKSNTDYSDRQYPSVACIVGMFVCVFCLCCKNCCFLFVSFCYFCL